MIKEIIEHAAAFLQMEELHNEIINGNTATIGGMATVIGKPHLDGALRQLLTCANLVITEVASYYFPLRARQTIKTTARGVITFVRFRNRRVIDIISVSRGGSNVRYERQADRIILPPGTYEIEYTFLPEALRIENRQPFSHKIGARILALGTVCEYCIISSMLDEAAMWDKRYRDAVVAASMPRREVRLPRRRFL